MNASPSGPAGATATSDYARALIEWFEESARDLPWRAPGFGAWGILVSEFMLQQTPVARVIPRLEEWLERWPTPEALAADSPGEAPEKQGSASCSESFAPTDSIHYQVLSVVMALTEH
jgi:A/G-specific adenine glycosylase